MFMFSELQYPFRRLFNCSGLKYEEFFGFESTSSKFDFPE
jgi:hypothetical protein